MKLQHFAKPAILLSVLLIATQSAVGASIKGADALALAFLVSVHSPVLGMDDTLSMQRLFNRKIPVSHANTKTISIGADVIVCQVDNVDIAARSCRLTFGAKTVNLNERAAQELYATMAEAGVPSEGAASKVSKSLSRLVCTINPQEIGERNGGGADCTFDVAAPK
jgi:hypothetical protein